MPTADLIATAMEMSIATLMLLFAGFLLVGAGNRNVPALALAGLIGIVGCSVVLSLLGSVETLAFLRGLRPLLALLAGPALLIYTARVATPDTRLGPATWLLLVPVAGGMLLMMSPAARHTDLYLNTCLGAYWLASASVYWRRRAELAPIGVRRFVLALVAVFGLILVLDIVVSLQFREFGRYRSQPAYLFGLLVMFAGAARLMWTALGNPDLLVGPDMLVKYRRSGLDAAASEALGRRLDELMETRQCFLEGNVSLAAIAGQLDVSPRHLSQVINTRFGTNFSAYINTQRVKEAAARLANTDRNVSEVMYAVGFSSKSSFNREFRRHIGMSPKEWRASQQGRQPSTEQL